MPGDPHLEGAARRRRRGCEFCANYFADLIEQRRAEPTDDLIGALVTDDADDALDDGELNGMLILLFVAGLETTTNLVGNAVVC